MPLDDALADAGFPFGVDPEGQNTGTPCFYNMGTFWTVQAKIPEDFDWKLWVDKLPQNAYGGPVVLMNVKDSNVPYKKAAEWQKRLDEEAVLAAFVARAEGGNAKKMNSLGYAYGVGKAPRRGCRALPKDNKKAFEWYTRAAELDFPMALNNLAWCYAHGSGCERNGYLAAHLFTRAAELGSHAACIALGRAFAGTSKWSDLPKDEKAAIKWFRKGSGPKIVNGVVNV